MAKKTVLMGNIYLNHFNEARHDQLNKPGSNKKATEEASSEDSENVIFLPLCVRD